MTAQHTPPLTSVTVRGMEAFMAAPFAAMQLADLGAEIVEVDYSVGGGPDKAEVSGAPIAAYGKVFTDEHLTARDFLWDVEYPAPGLARQLGSPRRLSETLARRAGAGPSLGVETREVLLAASCSAAEVDHLIASDVARRSSDSSDGTTTRRALTMTPRR